MGPPAARRQTRTRGPAWPGCRTRVHLASRAPSGLTGPVKAALLSRRFGMALALAGLVNVLHADLPVFDFTDPAQSAQWGEPHHLASRETTPDGLVLNINGPDPWIISPARDYPPDQPLWLHLRLKSDQTGTAQVFYFPAAAPPTESDSVRFAVRGGEWVEVKVRLPALGPSHRLRFDPPGTGGTCVLGRLWFSERLVPVEPDWPAPTVPEPDEHAAVLESGELKVVHTRAQFGGFLVEVAGERMAAGHNAPLVGYRHAERVRWFPINAPGTTVMVQSAARTQLADAAVGGTLVARARLTDPDGGQWQFEHVFKLNAAGSLVVEASARCDQDREVFYLPLFTLLPGLGSYGTNKTQALLAGVEYLENEPSSSTADLNPPASHRQVADTAKLTFPLMAVAARDRFVALAWNQPPGAPTCAVFDSPDRLLRSGAQVMGLLFPGSDGLNREESSLLPYDAELLPANKPARVAGLLLGGRGRSVVPAVRAYVQHFGLPPLPDLPGGTPAYLELAARGWLDSQIRDGDKYRHAAPGFPGQPAADAALYMHWLAGRVNNPALAERLARAATGALSQVAPPQYNHAQIGHVRDPVPALVYGAVAANLDRAEEHARSLLGRFEADGFIRYQPGGGIGGLDYGRTHWAPDANGLTAGVLAVVLQEAAFSGRPELIAAGLRHLRALTERYRDGVPRGAQTWEIPLHTPDILASAYLVRCYVLGYELTGETGFLDEALYWAWTGVPFVYLNPPTDQPVGLYATIPVLGATQWIAPNWIGLPVQWCGLVYADALLRLARHASGGPWRQLAEGIVRSGIQQTYPADDVRNAGLLPDSFNLRAQVRNPANINPATLLVPAVRALELPAVYDFRVLSRQGARVHAPGELRGLEERTDGFRFSVTGWSPRPYYVLINGLRQTPQVRVNGRTVLLSSPHEFQPAAGRLVLQVSGTATVEVDHPALAALRIGRDADRAMLLVRWPAAGDFVLQTAVVLNAQTDWVDWPEPAQVVGDQWVVGLYPRGEQGWFRLRR